MKNEEHENENGIIKSSHRKSINSAPILEQDFSAGEKIFVIECSQDFGSSLAPNSATRREGSSITPCTTPGALLTMCVLHGFPMLNSSFMPSIISARLSVSEKLKRNMRAMMGKSAKRIMRWRLAHLRGSEVMIWERRRSEQLQDNAAWMGDGNTRM
jgi:hypothetical protein